MNRSELIRMFVRYMVPPGPISSDLLVERLLSPFVGFSTAIERRGDIIVVKVSYAEEHYEEATSLTPDAFLDVVNQIVAICNEQTPGALSIDGGEAVLSWNHHLFAIKLRTAYDKQFTELKTVTISETKSLSFTEDQLTEFTAVLEHSSASDDPQWTEKVTRLGSCLERLPADYRAAISLFHIQSKSLAETAAEMKISKQDVSRFLRRGLCQLKNSYFEQHEL